MEERRKRPRSDVDSPARLIAAGQDVPVLLHDICRDAVFVEAETRFEPGTKLGLVLELPGLTTPIQVTGEVIRTAPGEVMTHGMALLFDDVPAGIAARIDFFVAIREHRPPSP